MESLRCSLDISAALPSSDPPAHRHGVVLSVAGFPSRRYRNLLYSPPMMCVMERNKEGMSHHIRGMGDLGKVPEKENLENGNERNVE